MDNEFLVLPDPSGCSKSTVLRVIAGQGEISGGEISVGSRVADDLPPRGFMLRSVHAITRRTRLNP